LRQSLVEEAKRLSADSIFVGAKGHSRLERLLIGSVSAAVAASPHLSRFYRDGLIARRPYFL
jgi:nucleotide-binding universal stress UspA family protein